MRASSQAQRSVIEITAGVVSAYVASNSVPTSQLPSMLGEVYSALRGLFEPERAAPEPVSEQPTSAQIRKSVTPDALISFIDGKPYKTLKRHLTGHGLDPLSYRTRYGLPKDYPMVAPNYAARRSELAKAIGLGLVRPDTGLPAATSQVELVAKPTERKRRAKS